MRKWVKHISAFGSDMSCIKYKLLYYLFGQTSLAGGRFAPHVFLFGYLVARLICEIASNNAEKMSQAVGQSTERYSGISRCAVYILVCHKVSRSMVYPSKSLSQGVD